MNLSPDQFAGFAGLAVLAACWRQVLATLNRLRSVFLVRVTVQGDIAQAVTAYCLQHFRRSPIGDRAFRSGTAFVRPVGRMQEVGWERPPLQPLILFDGWKPLMMGGTSSFDKSVVSDDSLLTLTLPRWLFDAEQLLAAALEEFNRLRSQGAGTGSGRYQVRRIGGRRRMDGSEVRASNGVPLSPANVGPSWNERFIHWKREDIGPMKAASPLASLALAPVLQDAVQEFERWLASEDWFLSRQVPWRRGWLLHGPPGTGKTSLVRGLAQHADIPVFVYDISSLDNEEFVNAWRDMQECAPCMALIEDIDAVFHGRQNITGERGGGLTFDCLLNCLSGLETASGVFVIVTTNDISKLDAALGIPGNGGSTRPGRLDRAIEVPPLDVAGLQQIANRILSDWPAEAARIVQECPAGTTGAQITERCVARALELYWEGTTSPASSPPPAC